MDSVVKESGHFESFDGTPIYFETRGRGEPLFFCYGIGCLFNHWDPQIRYFAKSRKTIMMDYRGHHKSPIPDDKKTLTIESLAKDILVFCEKNEIEKMDFVGHSFGCQVLLSLHEMKPELFRTLHFVNGLHRNPFEHMIEAEDLIGLINQAKGLYNQAPGLISTIWQKGVMNPMLIPLSALTGGFNLSQTAMKDIEIYAKGVAAIDFRVFLTFFEDMIGFNAEDYLTKIKTPTLIICGSKDALTPMEQQEKMTELIASSELYPIPYGSHCTQLDFPEMVNLKIQMFMEKVKKDSFKIVQSS